LPFLPLLLALGVASCALTPKSASGPVFVAEQVPPGKAVIYFYRPKAFALSARTVFLSIPKEADNCFAMVNNGYKGYVAGPGPVTIGAAEVGTGKAFSDFSATLKAGETRYVTVKPEPAGIGGIAVKFQEVPAGDALPEIKEFRLIDACPK